MPNYLIPTGRDGFLYGPEITSVLKKYQKLKVDLGDDEVIKLIAQDITKEIQSLPLSCVEVEDAPVKKIPEIKTS